MRSTIGSTTRASISIGGVVANRVTFQWQQRLPGRPTAVVRGCAMATLARLGRKDVEVGVLMTDDATVRTLNRRWRGKDQPTDVLSFPSGDLQPEGGIYLGDVAISCETAERDARAHGVDLLDELKMLLVHALLHLCGYDHETDKGEMAAKEAEIRRELGL